MTENQLTGCEPEMPVECSNSKECTGQTVRQTPDETQKTIRCALPYVAALLGLAMVLYGTKGFTFVCNVNYKGFDFTSSLSRTAATVA